MVNIQIFKDNIQITIIQTSKKSERRFSQVSENVDPKLQLLKKYDKRLMAWPVLPVAVPLYLIFQLLSIYSQFPSSVFWHSVH